MATQLWTMQVIEALNLLWTSLPLRGVTDERAALESYGFALDGNSIEAITNVVSMLRRGEIEDASKDFCPKAPKLAEYVRAEQRRLDAINRPPAVSYMPVKTGFKDWNIIQRQRTEELEADGYRLVKSGVTIDEFSNVSKRKGWQIGAIWFWQIQEVWAPLSAAYPSSGKIPTHDEIAA